MDLIKVLAQLRQELDHINAAILSLECLQAKETRRGRPPGSLLDIRRLKSPTRRPGPTGRKAERGRPK